MKIYNTLSKKLEDFQPQNPPKVSFYQCGPTVYWTQHIGNMRAMVLADLMRRTLAYLGYEVKFARNYTDVGHMTTDEDGGEDKMTKAAKLENLSPADIADKYIKQFEADVAALNCLAPDESPRATGYIPQMQQMVQTLIDKGYAYATGLAIYFDISKFPNYTALSGQKLDMNKTDAGKGEVGDSGKRNAADFAVWFFKAGAHQNALQTWPYEFSLPSGEKISGQGFPGWHLECSAMNLAIFGPTVDLHLGGIEHVPVHHTNEIAQSEAASGVKFVRYWLHNEHLTVDGSKMSKSDGTAYSLADLADRGYDPLVLRYFFLQAQYRSKQNFTFEALDAAKTALLKIQEFAIAAASENGAAAASQEFREKFRTALADDFNLPSALAVVWDLIKSDSDIGVKYVTLIEFDQVLGLGLSGLKAVEIPAEIKQLASARWQARTNKDWAESDRLRAELEAAGWQMEDGKDDYKLKKV